VFQRKAFTLVELLVVIGVIALLLAILVPAIEKARKQARTAACQVNLRQWGTTLAAFAEDNDGLFLHASSSHEDIAALWILTGRRTAEMTDHLQAPGRYHPVNTKGMLCPEATTPGDVSTTGFSLGEDGTSWHYDIKIGGTNRAWVLTESGGASDEVGVSCGSYGLNGWLFKDPGGPPTLADRIRAMKSPPAPPSYTNIFLLRRSAGVPLLLDSMRYAGAPTEDARPPVEEEYFRDSTMAPFCINRHSEQINSLFLDWSVRKVGLKELWTLKWHKDFNRAGPWTRAGGVNPSKWAPWMRGFKDY